MPIALDRQAEPSAHARQLREADRAEFREAKAEVAETKGKVWLVGIDLGEKPGRAGIRGEEFDDGEKIDLIVGAADRRLLPWRAAIRLGLARQSGWDTVSAVTQGGRSPSGVMALTVTARP